MQVRDSAISLLVQVRARASRLRVRGAWSSTEREVGEMIEQIINQVLLLDAEHRRELGELRDRFDAQFAELQTQLARPNGSRKPKALASAAGRRTP
jgi:hypothetical protein